MSQQRPRKFQRVSKACDLCNRRSIKCSKTADLEGRCQNCADFDVPCTFDRPIKRRGVKSSRARSDALEQRTSISSTGIQSQLDVDLGQLSNRMSNPWESLSTLWSSADNPLSGDEHALRQSWGAFVIATEQTIRNLMQVYFEIVYPIFPLFHRPSFLEKFDRNEHLKDRGFFASTMAACALASGRARDGALYSKRWHPSDLTGAPSEVFYAAAKDAIPKDLSTAKKSIDFMRACAILAIASIQNGQIKLMQQYLGQYHTLLSMEGLHDEKLWPKELNPIETEERRRLFWSIYTLDIYSSIVWGGIIRHREAQSMVRYPMEIDDELITEAGYITPPTSPNAIPETSPISWLRGWNFTTDLYRILEHAVDALRCRGSRQDEMNQFQVLFDQNPITESVMMEHVLAMYSVLPFQFRETLPVTGDPARDLFGFQSANIQATLQLLRMVLFSKDELGVERKCDVAGELLRVFSRVPVEYLKAISSPLLHHLAGIGYILGSVMESNLSEVSYGRVRMLLLEMADLLYRLESGLHRTVGASERLRIQVERIDEFMQQKRGIGIVSAVQQQQQSLQAPETETISSVPYNQAAGYSEPLSLFQLPSELLEDWPWPFDSGQMEGLFQLNFA